MKKHVMTRALTMTAALSASLGATPLSAQTPGADSNTADIEITEIIVTARRTEERLQDVPISITVFNQEQLTNRNVTTATDLANFTPSLSANSSYGPENTTFAIRGFVQDTATPPSVGTYFADVVAPRGPTQGTQAGDSVGPGSFFDLQNVQVLKGPQGTLFGRNTTGGAVLLVPQKPTGYFEGYGEASYGNYDMYRVQGALNAPLSDAARFRIAVDHQKRDGYLKNISGIGPDDFNDVNYTAVRASLVLDLGNNVENYTIASWSKSDTNGSTQKIIACDPSGIGDADLSVGLTNFMGVFSCGQLAAEEEQGAGFYDVQSVLENPVQRIDQWQVINTTTWRATDTLTVKNIASYSEYTNKQRTGLFGTNWQVENLAAPFDTIFASFGIPALFTLINPIPGGKSADQATYTEELQIQGASADNRFTYQGGIYFEWSDPLSTVGFQSSVLASCTDLDNLVCSDPLGSLYTVLGGSAVNVGAVNYTAGRTTYRNRGVYFQSSYDLSDQLELTTGIRYTWDEQRNTATRISYSFPVVYPYTGGAEGRCTDPALEPSCRQTLEQKSDKPTWLLGLDYKPNDDMLVYGKYVRGYRAGGVFTNAPFDLRTFEPEKVDSFEVGLKSTYRGDVRATFNVALFYNDFSNQQLQLGIDPRTDPVTGLQAAVSPTTAIINAGKSRIYGAEIETSITPVQGLTFDLAYTYLNTEVREIAEFSTSDPNYEPQEGGIRKGDQLALSPKHKVVLTGTYTLPLPESIGHISASASLVHTGKQLVNYIYKDEEVDYVALLGGNYGEIKSRELLSLNASWVGIMSSPVDLTAFATNVTNKHYYNYIPGLGGSVGAESAVLGEPRMYGVRLRYRFGDQQ